MIDIAANDDGAPVVAHRRLFFQIDSIPGVGQQVEDHLFDAVVVGQNGRQIFGQLELNIDILQAQLAADDIQDGVDGVVDQNLLFGEIRLAPKVPKPTNDSLRPVYLTAYFMNDLVKRLFGYRCFLLDHHLQKFTAHFYGVKRLVEFMGDTGGHFTQRRHLAGLNQLAVLFHHFGDIRRGHDQRTLVLVWRRTGMHIDVERLAAFLEILHLGADGGDLAGLLGAGIDPLIGIQFKRTQIGKRPTHKLLPGVAVGFLGTGVGAQDCQRLAIQHENRVGSAGKQRAVFVVRLLELGLGLLDAVGHVDEGHGELPHLVFNAALRESVLQVQLDVEDAPADLIGNPGQLGDRLGDILR